MMRLRVLTPVWLMAMLLSPAARPAQTGLSETFDDRVVDLQTWQVYPANQWVLTPAGTVCTTPSPAQDVRHITLAPRVNLQSVAVKWRCLLSEQPGTGVQLRLTFDSGAFLGVRVEPTVIKIEYRPTAADKPAIQTVPRPSDAGQDFWPLILALDSGRASVRIQEKDLAHTPAAGLDAPASLSVMAYRANVEIDRIDVTGQIIAPPPQRLGTPLEQKNYRELAENRFYPQDVVRIDQPREGIDLAPAADLPPLQHWTVGQFDGQSDEFARTAPPLTTPAMDFRIGVDQAGLLPYRLVNFQRRKGPETVRFFFHLAKDGPYTVRFALAGAKNLANVLHWTLDGHPLLSDVYRGANPQAIHSMFVEHIPVHLKAGPHVLEVKMQQRQSLKASFMHSIQWDAVALSEGHVPVIHEDQVGRSRPLNEVVTEVTAKRLTGRNFHYRVTHVPAKPLTLELTFHQPVTEQTGYEVFDVACNDALLLTDFDIAAEGGWKQPLVKTFPVTAADGVLDLHFAGKVGRASVNQIRLLDDATEIARFNVGCSADRNFGFLGPEDLVPRNAWDDQKQGPYRPTIAKPYPWLPDPAGGHFYEDAVNLVPDPSLERSAELAAIWRPIPDVSGTLVVSEITGAGQATLDDQTARTGKRSIRMEASTGMWGLCGARSPIDWTRPYRFTAWIKAQNATGKSYLELVWFKPDGKAVVDGQTVLMDRGTGRSREGYVPLPQTAQSQPVDGTFDWRPIEIRAYPPHGAFHVQVRLRSDDNHGQVWFDDLRLEGYGDLPVEVIASLAGYHTQGPKQAVIVSQEKLASPRFELVRLSDGKVVHAGQPRYLQRYPMLQRYAYAADFTSYQEAGRYHVRLGASGLDARTSLPFEVTPDFYLTQAQRAAFYHYTARCGAEVPGYHQACHTDDAMVASFFFDGRDRIQTHEDLTGGWHDAGDYGKFNQRLFQPIHGLAYAYTLGKWPWKNYAEPLPDVLSETVWGADYLAKLHRGNGLFLALVNGGFAGGHPAFAPELETDGNPWTVDGMGRTAAYYTGADPTPALALAKAAIAIREVDPARAARYLQIAQLNYRNTTLYWDSLAGKNTPPWKQLVFQSRAMWAAVTLFEATGKPEHRTEAQRRAGIVLDLLDAGVHRQGAYFVYELPARYNNFPWAYADGLIDFAQVLPDDPLASQARQSVQRVIEEWILPATTFRANPFGVIEHLHSDELWYYPEHNYTTEFFVKTAWTLARAGRLYNQPRWLEASERNLQWLLGLNHLNASYVSGVGDRQMAIWCGLLHVPGLGRGIIPGSVAKGITWGRPTTSALDWNNRFGGPGYTEPPGYAVAMIHDGQGYFPHGPATEITEQFAVPILMTCAELNQVRSPQRSGQNLPPLPVGSENLIPNSGFEQVTGTQWLREHRPAWEITGNQVPAAWDFNGGQAGRVTLVDDPQQARQGQRCLLIEKLDAARSASLLTPRPEIPTHAGQEFWTSLWVRGQGTIHVFALEYDEQGYIYARRLTNYRLNEAWDRLDLHYQVPEKSLQDRVVKKVRFAVHLAPTGKLYLDEFQVRRLPEIPLPRPERLK